VWLIVGLGNRDDEDNEYTGTYHNVGFRVLDRIAAREAVRANGGWDRCGPALISR